MGEYPTLNFGQHRGRTLDQVPADYVRWLADPARATAKPKPGQKPYRALPADLVAKAREMMVGIEARQESERLAKALMGGADHAGPDPVYVIETDGDMHVADRDGRPIDLDSVPHPDLASALGAIAAAYPRAVHAGSQSATDEERSTPDPEDDRILVWEILPTGHRKVVWGFFGWHWSADEFACGQGNLLGDDNTLYGLAMRDM